MKVTCEITDYSNHTIENIKIHSVWNDSEKVELEIGNEKYIVDAKELISAVKRATLDCFGK